MHALPAQAGLPKLVVKHLSNALQKRATYRKQLATVLAEVDSKGFTADDVLKAHTDHMHALDNLADAPPDAPTARELANELLKVTALYKHTKAEAAVELPEALYHAGARTLLQGV